MPSKTPPAQYKPPFWGQASAEFAVRARLGQGLCLCAFRGLWRVGGLRMGGWSAKTSAGRSVLCGGREYQVISNAWRSKCGRGLAPDGGGSATNFLAGTPSSGASPLPHLIRGLTRNLERFDIDQYAFKSQVGFKRFPAQILADPGALVPTSGQDVVIAAPITINPHGAHFQPAHQP